ncbi:DNA polymerase phi subunit [Kwoniella heveanensis CBS 569]|nr:DNA polymerase phi subunit [Kwoniella heveanensis CBS 569]
MASNILPLFWPLANSSKDTRLTASASLISSLENFQSTYTPPKPTTSSSDEDELDDDEDDAESGMEVDASDDEDGEGREERDLEAAKLDKQLSRDNAEDVVYCVKRLVRGLGSSRESSRLGFAVALTELLTRIKTVTASQVLSLLIRNSQYSKNMKGSDERDMMFARLFGLTSIVQSKSLFAASPSATQADFQQVVHELIKLGQGKAWIRESAWWTLIGAVQGLLESDVEWKDAALEQVVKVVLGEKGWTQEKVALVLLLEDKIKTIDWKTHFAPTFKYTPLLNSHNLVTLGRVLKEASAEDDEGVAASTSGSWKPQLHFVWNIILDHYFPSKAGSPTAGGTEAPFQDFFRVVVDESLFSNTASPQRRYWGFQVFERALPLLPASQMPLIFTPNFMRCWMNNLSSSDRYLHKAALGIAKRVQEVTKENPKVGFTLLSQLVGKHGRQDFDKVTKTKTVENIMGSLNAEGVKDFVAYLQEVILVGGDNLDNARIEERRLWALDQLLALCRNGSVPKDDAWISSLIDFLLVHGFFLVRKADKKSKIGALHTTPKPALSESTAAVCRARLASCLVELTTASVSQRGSDENKTRQQGCDVSGKLWLRRALETLSALEGNKKHVELMTDADEEIKAIRNAAVSTVTALEKVKEDQKDIARGAEILLAFFVLQTYDEVDDALDLLEDAKTAAEKLFGIAAEQDELEEDGDKENAAPIDSLLDVLIALLEKGSSDLRNLANLVFGMISPAFTQSSIKLLTAQLEQNAATAAAAEAEDDDEEESDGEDEEGSGDDDEAEEDDDDEDDMAPVDPAFRARVAEALNVAGMGVNEDADGDDEDEEEEVWDDEQMMKVDEQLAEVFRQQASGTKRSDLKHLQIESLHFKNRILDFFDVYARKQSTNPLILTIAVSLLKLVRASGTPEGELANKSAGILKNRFNKPKEYPTNVDVEEAAEVLEEIHEMARKAVSAEFSNLCSLVSLFVVKSIDTASSSSSTSTSESPSPVVQAYGKTLADFMTRKASLVHPNFVSDFIKRFPTRAFGLYVDLNRYVAPGGGVNAYRQVQAYGMLQTLSQHLPVISKSGIFSSSSSSSTSVSVEGFIKSSSESVFSTLELASSSSSSSTKAEKEKEKESAGGAEGGWNAAKLKDVVKFALQLARASKNVDQTSAWDMHRVNEIENKLKAGEKTKEMKGVLSMWAQLLAVLGQKKDKQGKKANGGKRKADDVVTEDDRIDVDVDGDVEISTVDDKGSKKEKKAKAEKSTDASKKKAKVDGQGEKKEKKAKKAKTTSS